VLSSYTVDRVKNHQPQPLSWFNLQN